MQAELHQPEQPESGHGIMLLLGSMGAEERLTAFLIRRSQRFAHRGYSAQASYLRMTREEIYSHLELKLESVSRVFSRFQEEQLIEINNKHVRITNVERLRVLIGQPNHE